jgi:hypothetical protein
MRCMHSEGIYLRCFGTIFSSTSLLRVFCYSGRKITESFGNVTVRGEKYGKSKRGARLSTVCLSMYSITENIYYSQLSSVAILLQPEPNGFTSYNTSKWLCFLSLCAIVIRSTPASHVSTSNSQRSSQLFCIHYTWYSAIIWCWNSNVLAQTGGVSVVLLFLDASLWLCAKTQYSPCQKVQTSHRACESELGFIINAFINF